MTFGLMPSGQLSKNYTLVNGDSVTVTGTINPATLENVTVVVNDNSTDEVEYLGDDTVVTLAVTSGEITLTADDYEVTFSKDNGRGWVTVSPKTGSNYTFTAVQKSFAISEATLDAADLTVSTYEWTIGTDIDLTGVTVTKGEATIAGQIDPAESAAAILEALTAGESAEIDATFTPSSDVYASTPISIKVPVTAKAAVDTSKAALTADLVDATGLTLNYTQGSDTVDAASIATEVTLVAGGTVAGTFSVTTEQANAIKAMTESGTATVTFNPAEDNETYNTTAVELTVNVVVKTTGSGDGEEQQPDVTVPEQSEAKGEEVQTAIIVLGSNEVALNRKGEAKPSIKVYFDGKALSSRKYETKTVVNGDGTATTTVTLDSKAGCTFEGGKLSASVTFDVVAYKAKVSALTVKATTVTYGQIDNNNVASMLKGAKLVIDGKTQKTGVTYEWNLAENATVGEYFVKVTATYGNEKYEAEIPVTVKAAKLSVKTQDMGTYTGTLTDEQAKTIVENYLADTGINGVKLTAEDCTVQVTKTTGKGTKKTIYYKIILNEDGNYNFGSNKFTKSAKATVNAG
jgi:hypothetical protein